MISSANAAVNADDLVQTPYGLISKENIVEVNSHQTVKVLANQEVVVTNKATGALVRDYGMVLGNADAQDPLNAANDVSRTVSETDLNGYYASVPLKHIKSFSTTWIVPSIPQDPVGKTYFLWNALAGGSLQPVMQWGNGRSHYAIANWAFVGKYFHGKYIQVNPGTKLTGVITLESHDAEGWHYKESFLGYPDADLYVTRPTEATGIVECSEAYTTDHSQYPANLYTSMDHIKVTLYSGTLPANLRWQGKKNPKPTPSGKNIVVVNSSSTDGRLDFYFH